MSTRSMIGKVEAGGRVRAVYCHWGGTPDSAGGTLANYWADPGKVDQLLEMGSLSHLGQEIGERHDPADFSKVNEWSTFHGRDMGRGGPEYEAVEFATDRDYMEYARAIDCRYVYLWTAGGWQYAALPWGPWAGVPADMGRIEWQSLTAALQDGA